MLTIKGYVCAAIASIFFVLAGVMYFESSVAVSKLKAAERDLTSYATMQAQATKDANASVARVQERIVYRTKQSEPIYRYIETYKGDTNASDCDNNMSLLRSFTF